MTPPPSAPQRSSLLSPSSLVLVFLGGAAGTAGRYGLGLLLPANGSLPITILLANLLGAFSLGLLLEVLARRGKDAGRRRALRLLLGTGFLGGFTTYSALATDSMLMLHQGAVFLPLVYGLGTVLLGGLSTWCGIAIGTKFSAPQNGGERL